MVQKLNDFSSASVIPAIEESLREYWSNFGHASQSEIYETQGFLRVYTGIPFAFLNGVSSYNLPKEEADQAIEECMRYFQNKKVPWEWFVGPQPSPVNLVKSLTSFGLQATFDMPGMANQLNINSQDFSLPQDVKIIPVEDVEAIKIWTATAAYGYEIPELYDVFTSLESSLGCQPHYRRYLAYLNHEPVATAALFLGKNVSGIYAVATIPAARRKGIGAAITKFAMREAHTAGYHIAVLQSSGMGKPVYQKLGFQEFSTLYGYMQS